MNKSFLFSGRERSWKTTLIVMFFAQFIAGIGFSFVLPFIPFYLRHLGIESDNEIFTWSGLASFGFGTAMFISAPLWGIVADRYGRKLMVLRSMFAGTIVLGLVGLATQPWHLVAFRILQGFTTGTVTASVVLVASVTPKNKLGFGLAFVQTGLLLGSALGPYLGGILAESHGFRVSSGISSLILLAGTILVFFGASENFTPEKHKTNGFDSMRGIVKLSGFKVLLLIFFLIYVLRMMVINILPIFIEHLTGETEGAISLTGKMIGATGFLAGLSAIFFGRIGDRIGYNFILLFSLFSAGVFGSAQYFATDVNILFIEQCLLGLAVGGLVPAVNVLVSRIVPQGKIGSAYGLTASVTCLGIGTGPLLGSAIANLWGIRMPFAVMGLLSFLIAILVLRTVSLSSAGEKIPKETLVAEVEAP